MRTGAAITMVLLGLAGGATGQGLSERIDRVRSERGASGAAADERGVDEAAARREVARRLAAPMAITLEARPLRGAFEAWAELAGVALVVDWRAMEIDGVDVERPVTLELAASGGAEGFGGAEGSGGVAAADVLLLLMDAASEELRFVAEVKSYGVRVRTRDRANRDVVTRVYDVRDLVMEVPMFDDAPSLDLRDALSNTSSGGGGGGGGGASGGGVFRVEELAGDGERPRTKDERGALLAEAVRGTVEPDIWRENGGEYSSLRYRQGLLIVRAPAYVHAQIGRAAVE